MSRPCVHAAAIQPVPSPGTGCETCLEMGDAWVHLRQCMTCGRTLCCDDSPNRHMSRHCRTEGHPVMRCAEPAEDWMFCLEDDSPIREDPSGWVAFDWYVETGIGEAAAHLSRGLSWVAPPPMAPDGFDLGDWARYVRSLHAAGRLDPDDAAAIEALPGWAW